MIKIIRRIILEDYLEEYLEIQIFDYLDLVYDYDYCNW